MFEAVWQSKVKGQIINIPLPQSWSEFVIKRNTSLLNTTFICS